MNRQVVWICVGIVALTLIAYAPAIQGGFIWDDDDYVQNNPVIRDAPGLWSIWFRPAATPQYYPLVHSTFWLEYQLWGLNPMGYHIVNVLLHAFNALLLGRLLSLLSVPRPWLVALLFAIHPVHVESVAWITERKNVLSATFYFLAALAFLRFWDFTKDGGERKNWQWYIVTMLFFVASLFSKTVTASLPAALTLLIWWKRGRLKPVEIVYLIPMFSIGIFLGALTVWLEKHHVGALGSDWDFLFVERMIIAGRAIWFYAYKLIWPAELIFNYPRWSIHWWSVWQYVFPIGVLLVIGVLWRMRDRVDRGPVVAACYFAGTLVPALGFFDVFPMVYSFVADHFQYLASIGMLTLYVATAQILYEKFIGREKPILAGLLVVCLTMLLTGLTFRQSMIYRDLETLWVDTLAKNPNSYMAHNNLGRLLSEQKDYAGAERHFRVAIRLKPNFSVTYCNLGRMREVQGDPIEGKACYEQAIRVDPKCGEAMDLLGEIAGVQGNRVAAKALFQRAIAVEPFNASARANLGVIYQLEGNLNAAIECYEMALHYNPDSVHARKSLANVLIAIGDYSLAEVHLRAAIQLEPEKIDSAIKLVSVLVQQHRKSEATAYAQQLMNHSPTNDDLRESLKVILELNKP